MSAAAAPGDTVLVTGGTGFVAGHVVAHALAAGLRVRATVRDPEDPRRTGPLTRLAERHPGRLELHRADLLEAGSFDEAMDGCRAVLHVASPFLVNEQMADPVREVVTPAVEGTREVLAAVGRTPSVARVVLTSTVGAMFGDYVDVVAQGGSLREDMVNTTSTPSYNPYHYAKTAAEQLAWETVRAQDRWSLVSLNPGLVLGPTTSPESTSGSLFLVDELFRGEFWYGAPDFAFTLVDVRDLAQAHVAAATTPSASGRYVLARDEMVGFLEMGRIVRDRYPSRRTVPRHLLPHVAVRVLGPRFGLSRRYIAGHLGLRFRVEGRRATAELGVTYRPVRDTVLDTYESWADRPST